MSSVSHNHTLKWAFLISYWKLKQGGVEHACNPRVQEAEAGLLYSEPI